MSEQSGDKILGFIPKDQYTQITYYLMLASGALGVLSNLLALVGLYLPIGAIPALIGLSALALVIAGCFAFKSELSAFDHAHLAYLGVVILAGFVLAIVLSVIGGIVGIFLSLLISIAMLFAVFAGFNSWSKSRTITKDNFVDEFKLAISRA